MDIYVMDHSIIQDVMLVWKKGRYGINPPCWTEVGRCLINLGRINFTIDFIGLVFM